MDIDQYKNRFLNEIVKVKKLNGLNNSLKVSIQYLEMVVKSIDKDGDLFEFLSHYQKNNKSRNHINEVMHKNGLVNLDTLIKEGFEFTRGNKGYITKLDDFIVGQRYSPWKLALISKTYTIQNGIFPINGPSQAILIVADLDRGVHSNQWLKENYELKYYFKKTPQGTYNHKYNKAIMNSKEKGVPLYVFIKDNNSKDSKNLILNGVFQFESVKDEGDKKWFKLVRNEVNNLKKLEKIIKEVKIEETEVIAMIKARLGHSKFRRILLQEKEKCEICGLGDDAFLIASHIKPWSKADNNERLDPSNGLLLCPNHDSAFDKGYISFDEDGSIITSKKLNENTKKMLNIQNNFKISLNDKQKAYMKWHRRYFKDILFEKTSVNNSSQSPE